jgi:hypothetical protein
MKKICINPKTYSLTKDKEYEIITELEKLLVINDKDLVRSYSKDLFKESQEETVLTLADLKWNISLATNDKDLVRVYNIDFASQVFIDIIFGELEERIVFYINTQPVAGNCGIRGIDGINILFNSITKKIVDYGFDNIEETVKNIFLDVIKELEIIARENNRAILVFSSNDDFPEMWNILDKWADLITEPVVNPDSNKEIKMWIKYVFFGI